MSAGTQILKAPQETLQTTMLTSAAAPLLEVVASFMPILSVLYARLCSSCLVLQQNYCQGKQINTRRALFQLPCHSCCFPCSAVSCYFTKFGSSLSPVAILQRHVHLLFNAFIDANLEATDNIGCTSLFDGIYARDVLRLCKHLCQRVRKYSRLLRRHYIMPC